MSKVMLALVLVLIATHGAVFYLGTKLSPSALTRIENAPGNEGLDDFKDKVQKWADESHERLKNATPEERQAKTDEMLGKVIQLFLVDLGLKLELLKADVQTSQAQVVSCAKCPQPVATDHKTAEGIASGGPVDHSQAVANRKKFEIQIIDSADPREITSLLSSVTSADVGEEFKSGETPSGHQMAKYAGKFSGQIIPLDRTQAVLYMVLDLKPDTSGKNRNKYEIKIGKDPKKFNSISAGEGSMEHFATNGDPSSPLFIQVRGDHKGSDYFQLYYIKHLEQFRGIFYATKEKNQPATPIGAVTLQKE